MAFLLPFQAEGDEPEATESDAQLSGVNILPEAEISEAESKAMMASAKGEMEDDGDVVVISSKSYWY